MPKLWLIFFDIDINDTDCAAAMDVDNFTDVSNLTVVVFLIF